MEQNARIYVAGHTGMVGSAVVRKLRANGHTNLLLCSRKELDLCNQQTVFDFFKAKRPEYVFVCAAKVGGIIANKSFPADFLYENLAISLNIIRAAFETKVEKLLYLGSSCIYPRLAPQPIPESALLSGPLEPTNEGYAISKIAGLKLCELFSKQYGARFISAMPTNLYGPQDHFDANQSHVVPGMLLKFHMAKEMKKPGVMLWGTGKPRREFLHVDDLADALYLLMKIYESPQTINVGSGEDFSILELAEKIKSIVQFQGSIQWDTSKPDGTPRKLLDIAHITSLGWKPKTPFDEGLAKTYRWACENVFKATQISVETTHVGTRRRAA